MTNLEAVFFEDTPMNNLQRLVRSGNRRWFVALTVLPVFSTGCAGPQYRELRADGQKAMLSGMYGPAKLFFEQADEKKPRQVENLHDLGSCSMMLAHQRFEQGNRAAALREADAAVAYFSHALDVHPGHQASLEGKNRALELKGQFDEALAHAEWAAKFVGPSARQFVFLAQELEERGDVDGALLRYRQAVAVESDNFSAHVAFVKFLLRNHNEPAAVHHLQVAYRLNPRDPWVLDQLASRGAVPTLARPTAARP